VRSYIEYIKNHIIAHHNAILQYDTAYPDLSTKTYIIITITNHAASPTPRFILILPLEDSTNGPNLSIINWCITLPKNIASPIRITPYPTAKVRIIFKISIYTNLKYNLYQYTSLNLYYNCKNMISKFPFLELHTWYQINWRTSLPWRDYNFSEKELGYRVWLAETMLQQTQVKRVKSYFENILEAFPTIQDLAAATYEEFFPYYKWLWYYSRARNMLKAAEKVVSDFGWVFPEETELLRTLPWVGPYTAEAIRAFAYDIPTLSFDTNLEKIFSRYFFGNKFQKLSKEDKENIMRDFQKSDISARDINNALMDYGATVSLNNISGINWETYPFPESKFYQTRWELEPVKEKKKSTFPTKQAYVIAILHENHKIYFSKYTEFSPFLIGRNTSDPRAMIQNYFSEKYGLELSVRPPEIKSYSQHETPYLVCYAQIQSWTHDFHTFENLKVRGFEEGYVEELEFGSSLSLF